MKILMDKIKQLEEFKPDMSFKDGMFILKLNYKTSWSIIKPNDDTIAYAADENVSGLHWYVCNLDNIDDLFLLIENTINVNREMEKKINLYKEKVKVLQELFLGDTPYEDLLQIQFVIPEAAKKRGRPKKNVKDTINEINVVEKENINEENNNSETISDIDKKIAEAMK